MTTAIQKDLKRIIAEHDGIDPSLKVAIIEVAERAERYECILGDIESAVTHSYQPLSDIVSILIRAMQPK